MFRVRTEKKCIPQVSHLFTAVTVLSCWAAGRNFQSPATERS